jgi:hypothetical protein
MQERETPPPIGLCPRQVARRLRVRDIIAALARYDEADLTPPSEWAWELYDHLTEIESEAEVAAEKSKPTLREIYDQVKASPEDRGT